MAVFTEQAADGWTDTDILMASCVCVCVYQLWCVLQQRQQSGLQDGGLVGGQALPQRQQQHQQVCGAPQTDKRLLQQRPVLLRSLRQRHHLEEGVVSEYFS